MRNILGIAFAVFIVIGCGLFIAGIMIGESFPKPLWIVALLSSIASAVLNIRNYINIKKVNSSSSTIEREFKNG